MTPLHRRNGERMTTELVADKDANTDDEGALAPGLTSLQMLNAAAILVTGVYLGRDLLVPLVLAVLLAFVLAPLVRLLRRARLGVFSVLLTVLLAFGIIGGIGLVVGNQAADLAASLPRYQATIQDKVRSFSVGGEVVERLAATAQRLLTGSEAAIDAPTPALAAPTAATAEKPTALVVVRTVLAPLLGPLATAGVVLVFLIFVLLYQEDLRDRLVGLVGRRDLHRTIMALNDAAGRLSQYFLVQLGLNTGFGVFITGALWLVGLPNPLLWGILAGVMRFVPFIGSAIALVPPVLLGLAVDPTWGTALVVGAVILGGDMVMSQVVEPLTFGHSTGLSPIAVILSAAFWAFMWGPIGLLLATPLTVCLVVIGRYVPALRFMHVMLSDQSPLEPRETFYQRALEGNQAELLRQARAEIARPGKHTTRMHATGTHPTSTQANGRAEYLDRVALGGLALAQADLARDVLAFDRLEGIHAAIERLLATLGQDAPAPPPMPPGPVPPSPVPATWAAPGAVLCIPGRGQLDDLAATMAVQLLQSRGFGARVLPNAALGKGDGQGPGDDVNWAAVRMCCVSALEEGSSAASIRFFLRRIQRRAPGAAVVVCLWHAGAGSTTLATLRAEGAEEFIVLSLGELLALAPVVAARTAAPLPAMP